jgi:outer membrane immunogenic protein
MKQIMVAIALVLFSSSIFAGSDGETYGSIQYALVTLPDDYVGDIKPTALIFRVGKFVDENISLEGRFGIGLEKDKVNLLGYGVDMEVDSIYGLYSLFHLNTDSDVSLYGLIGYSKVQVKASFSGYSSTGDEDGFSYGLGAKINSFTIEFMSYLDKPDAEATALSFGYVTEF